MLVSVADHPLTTNAKRCELVPVLPSPWNLPHESGKGMRITIGICACFTALSRMREKDWWHAVTTLAGTRRPRMDADWASNRLCFTAPRVSLFTWHRSILLKCFDDIGIAFGDTKYCRTTQHIVLVSKHGGDMPTQECLFFFFPSVRRGGNGEEYFTRSDGVSPCLPHGIPSLRFSVSRSWGESSLSGKCDQMFGPIHNKGDQWPVDRR